MHVKELLLVYSPGTEGAGVEDKQQVMIYLMRSIVNTYKFSVNKRNLHLSSVVATAQ